MKIMKNDERGTIKISNTSLVLYISSMLVILIGIAALINNVMLYNNTISQYVSQGYPAAAVIKQLLPQQLLPGIFEPVAVYGGIAAVLFGCGRINGSALKCISLLSGTNVRNAEKDEDVQDIRETEPEINEDTEEVPKKEPL